MSLRQGLGQQAVLRQDLRINPRLYQAMDLLYMPLMDLQQHLKQELLENPFLELEEPDDNEVATSDVEQERENKETQKEETNWEDILLDGFHDGGWKADSEATEYREPVSVQRQGLSEYLRAQVALLRLNERQMLLAETMIGNIGDDGYLTATLEEVVGGANQLLEEFAAGRPDDAPRPALFTEEEALETLKIIQNLDPPGTGARNLRECLMLQLKDQKQ